MIREYRPEDFQRVLELHKMRAVPPGKDFNYFADPRDPLNGLRFVAEENGKVVGVAVGRHTVEAFLELDRTMGPIKRARTIKALLYAGADECKRRGYGEIHAPCDDANFNSFLITSCGFNEDDRHQAWLNLSRPGA